MTGPQHGADKRALVARMLTRRASAPRSYPISFGQRRLWFLDRFQPGDPVYNIPVAYRISGPLDVPALRAALTLIVTRHGALRTTFAEAGGEPVQVVRPTPEVALEVTGAGSAAQARQLVWREARRPFDLTGGPLFRTLLVRVADDDHFLSLCLHHSVSDAWSLGVLFHELNRAYRALRDGDHPDLPDLPAQYTDFALWQRERLAGAALREQLDYWIDQLRGAPALITLPTDRPRPTVAAYRGAVHYFNLPRPLANRLAEFDRANGVTLFMTLMAGFTALLSRYSGQDELVVGTPVAGRGRADLEPLIGFFVNTLALRVSTAGAPSFRELVGRVREATLGGLANAEVPFERLVEELQPERSLGHAPIFQTQLILQNTPTVDLSLAGTTGASLRVDSGSAKLDLTLVGMVEADGGVGMAVEYDVALFDAETVARLGNHLTALLTAALADPERAVTEISLLSEVERWRAVVDWNTTARGLPPVASVLELICTGTGAAGTDHGVAGRADAVIGPDGAVDHVGLAVRAGRLARLLRANGVAPDTPVGLCLERGVGMLAGVLGVWRTGAGYLPLDPTLPAERLRHMLADSGARIVVTERPVRERLGAVLDGVRVVFYDDDSGRFADDPADDSTVAPHPDGLAYLIYTSGSTGRPKGVAVPHRALVNLVASFHDDLGLTAADRFAAVTTLSFDISILELLVPLISGAPLVIVDAATAADGAALRRRLVADGITAMQATPATWRLLIAAGGVPPGLRLRLCGGEALPRDLADTLIRRGDGDGGDGGGNYETGAGHDEGAILWNCYGPTETTVWSAAAPVRPAPAPIDLGTPIANTELYLLDPAGQPVPVGVVGEVHIGGAGVVRGYHGRPALTAARFVPDPFSGRPGARLYATGDLARQRTDGRLEFLGRADHQVKIRGFRIELGEIEELLRAHELVADAVVGTWRAGPDDSRLVAYVVPAKPATTGHPAEPAGTDDAGRPDPDGLWRVLRSWLDTRLPGYMVPAALVTLPALPVNGNGKIDRGRLPAPDWHDRAAPERTPPSTPVEELLVEIWQEVLRVEPVGIHDDFFHLGGHSLLATRALGRIGATFELDLPVRVLFEAPTVAAMADALVAREPAPGHLALIATLRRDMASLSTDQLRGMLGGEQP